MSRTPLHRHWWRSGVLALLALGAAWPAAAVFTTVELDTGSSDYQLLLRVGSAAGTRDTVDFSVTGNNIGLNPTPVTGTPDIDVWVAPLRPPGTNRAPRPVRLTVNSSGGGMACDSPTSCGSTKIPFSKISWTASNTAGGAAGDIQGGSFNGSTAQLIAGFNANATYCKVYFLWCWTWQHATQQLDATRLRFTYANDVIYPAGVYKGTVTFTATMP